MTAQCRLLNQPPAFGSFVRAEWSDEGSGRRNSLIAIVYWVTTTAAEAGRRPAPYGLTLEELRREQPQIFELLVTEFTALHLGIINENAPSYSLPPQPPPVHAFVYACTPEEVRWFTESPRFLRTTLQSIPNLNSEQLTAAAIKHANAAHGEEDEYLVKVGRELARQLHDDAPRLQAILELLTGTDTTHFGSEF